jgi:hypothetical protein
MSWSDFDREIGTLRQRESNRVIQLPVSPISLSAEPFGKVFRSRTRFPNVGKSRSRIVRRGAGIGAIDIIEPVSPEESAAISGECFDLVTVKSAASPGRRSR